MNRFGHALLNSMALVHPYNRDFFSLSLSLSLASGSCDEESAELVFPCQDNQKTGTGCLQIKPTGTGRHQNICLGSRLSCWENNTPSLFIEASV